MESFQQPDKCIVLHIIMGQTATGPANSYVESLILSTSERDHIKK